jgi:asparagine synthase (glutamine-hydrolysing)
MSALGMPMYNVGYFQNIQSKLSENPYNFNNLPTKDRILKYEFFVHSLPSLLRNFDRAGMMNSIEIRMPFLDWELVSFVFSLPLSSKVGNGYTKRILRESMNGKLPDSIRNRTYKVGVGNPLEAWVSLYVKEWFCDRLSDIKTTEAENALRIIGKSKQVSNSSDRSLAIISGWLEINRWLIEKS